MKKLLFVQMLLIFVFLLVGCGSTSKTTIVVQTTEPVTTTTRQQIPFPLDYRIDAKSDTLKILQITDPQIASANETDLYDRAYKYMDYVVEATQPDLIIVTGDIIYGRYDTTGSILTSIINRFESYGIPWAPVFGNHDNESPVGLDFQINKFYLAPNCMFVRRDELSGNGNYSIGLFINGELVRSLYMIDTKGCDRVGGDTRVVYAYGIEKEQRQYVIECQTKCEQYAGAPVKGFVAMHVMPALMSSAMYIKYDVRVNDLSTCGGSFTVPKNDDGDFGSFHENAVLAVDRSGNAFYDFADNNIDGIFAGHEHKNNASIYYDGIRMTYGLKSSTFDFYEPTKLGGTLIEVTKDGFEVNHIYYPSE